ncbi:MAG: carboxypeptidase regulatory-like domain-containing protein [Acidobacteria bacterium]|nr:carboxypeptidase regulatory-like domain-containing protein [Acidobacteriota bacterium]
MRCAVAAALLLLGTLAFAQAAHAQRGQAAPARSGMAVTVTDPAGATLAGVRVEILGPSDRSAETTASGQVSFPGLQAGTYRLRFSGEDVIRFEREITIRTGQVADVDVTLNPAPPPPEPPPPPPPEPPPPPPVGPAGQPQTLSIVDLVERELIPSNQPRRETLVACSGNTRTTLVQLNQDQPERLYDTAEISYYVVAGEGAVRVDARDTALAAGSLVSLPRGTAHSLVRRGRRPLILLVTLSGAPCEDAR